MRDWQDERWIKLYVRDEPEWLVLHWKWRGLFDEILKRLEPSGTMRLGRIGRKAIAASLSAVWDAELEEGVSVLEEDGAIRFLDDESVLVVPNFIEAQEAKQSDKARQRKRRERARVFTDVTQRDQQDTQRDQQDTQRDQQDTQRDDVTPRDVRVTRQISDPSRQHQTLRKDELNHVTQRDQQDTQRDQQDTQRDDEIATVTPCDKTVTQREKREKREREERENLTKRDFSESDPVDQVFAHYIAGWKSNANGESLPVLDDGRRSLIQARLDDGHSIDDLKQACDGLWQSDWHRQKKFWTIGAVCKSAETVERLMAEAKEELPWEWDPKSFEKPVEVENPNFEIPQAFKDAVAESWGNRSIAAKRAERAKAKKTTKKRTTNRKLKSKGGSNAN